MADDETHLAGSVPTSSSGWLTSTEAIDHGRFPPGTVLDGRYRVVGRLGRGGMGEVYRADDLKLGQPVALKFLPELVDRDPARLTQLHAEVRMARQVSHPNVCRVYDVGEFEGHTFLSMEYVDGEDLASLLRRIGRFPQDRAIELARQICAGLAAAHDRGVVHRDLKPANIMLDGTGRIRITDFGLAGASGEMLRAGTPAYMAPEQLAGQEVTPTSDLYALGLVLYEMFTGRRAVEARNVAELIAKREQVEITMPTAIVRDLDPAVERAIMRCLEPEPKHRPASALAVAAALPGGDPLAAALAAGETPSPEMVAASGRTSALAALPAIGALVAAVALLIVTGALADRVLLTSIAPIPKPPLLLDDRIKTLLPAIGAKEPEADSAHGFMSDDVFVNYAVKQPDTLGMLRAGRPAALMFWRRGSPSTMIPTGMQANVSITDPPMIVPGMTFVVTDTEGRLVRLEVVPPRKDAPGGSGNVNWKPLFDAADLDLRAFAPATPQWIPPQYADTRAAWTGPLPGAPGQQMRVEAAAYGGQPVAFRLVNPWTPDPATAGASGTSHVTFASAIATLIVVLVMLAAALVARHNLRRGRGDRRSAFQLAAFVTVLAVFVGLLNDKHIADPSVEMGRFFSGQPLWAAGLLWLLYLALEPYVRRFWPKTVVSWSRLMARQWRDPLVGRDILFGIAIGAFLVAMDAGFKVAAARISGHLDPSVPNLTMLLGTHVVLAVVLNQVFNALLNALFAIFGMILLKLFVRREWVAALVAIGLITFGAWLNSGASSTPGLMVTMTAIYTAVVVLTIQRLGLLATVAMFLVMFMFSGAVLTLDPGKWMFGPSLLVLAVPAALACYGFYAARAGEPLLGGRLLD